MEAIESNQGLTLLNYLTAGVDIRRVASIGFYFLMPSRATSDSSKSFAMPGCASSVWMRSSTWLGRFTSAVR